MCSLRFENNFLTVEGVRFASISKKTPLSKLSFAFVSLALPLLEPMIASSPRILSFCLFLSINVYLSLIYESAIGQPKPQSRQSAMLFLQSSELGLPQPLNPWGVCPSPRFGGEGHTRWRERGWESPNSDEGTHTVILFIFTYFVAQTHGTSL
jgi:hypothetical protein